MSEEINLNPVFFLLLAVASNFIGPLLGCQTQKLLTENIIAKHVILFSLLYFTLASSGDGTVHPGEELKQALTYYLIFLAISKTPLLFSILLLIVLAVMYNLQRYMKYLEQNDVENDAEKNFFELLKTVFLALLGFGLLLYLQKQYNDHRDDFDPFAFIFGTVGCEGKVTLS